ncbi:MAG: IS21 family transposase [Actinobacteria bacterium]|nr:IS21 family transposase [Actinomycetota bacterium]
MNVNDLHRQGWSISEIAESTGWHRSTVSKYLKEGPPGARSMPSPVMTDQWCSRIESLLESFPRLLAVSVHNRLQAEGFTGSYPTVVRAVRDIRGPRFVAADAVSVPIHTAPGDEAQFDFCDVSPWAVRFGWAVPLVVFGMILSWSRWRMWWFTTSEDRQHTFEGMVRFFEQVGGVPAACRTDRMGALGRSQGRRFELHPPTVGFAAHHGMKITSCQARDAKRKGKVERPFRQLQETFLPEVEADGAPVDIADLNRRAQRWLTERVHDVESRTTGEMPSARLAAERGFLTPLPRARFDTDYVETRRVHNVWPFVSIDANRYSVPPDALGHKVEIRRGVDSDTVQIRLAGNVIATHRLVQGRRVDVWDPVHRQAAETAALGWDPNGPDLRVITDEPDPEPVEIERLDLGGDYDVEAPDLGRRYPLGVEDTEESA